ncbi:MAG: cell envelope integrity protein TolA [Alphaproteobacteria bacterium]|nr:cell envelope integrity protein TolA [Alphaproteobacteria bacterium]
MRRDKSYFTPHVLLSAACHLIVFLIGFGGIFRFSSKDMISIDVEIAGAAEMNQAFEDFSHRAVPQDIPENNEPITETKSENLPEVVAETELNQFVEQTEPSITEDVLSNQLQDVIEDDPDFTENDEEETLRLEERQKEADEILKKEQQKAEKDRQQVEEQAKIRKEEAEKQERLRKKKELEALKKIEQKKKARKNRLAQIAAASKKIDAKKKADEEFDRMLRNEKKTFIDKSKKGNSVNNKFLKGIKRNGMGHGNGLGRFGDGQGFNDSDASIISSQVIPHWVVSGGVKNAESLIIKIRIKLKDNGEVIPSAIEILDLNRYNSDHVFRSAADSAKRAILEASPFKIPAEKMHLFRDFEFSFNTDKALGG